MRRTDGRRSLQRRGVLHSGIVTSVFSAGTAGLLRGKRDCQPVYPFEYIENSTGLVLDPYIYSFDELMKVEFSNGVKTKADIKRELSKHFSDQIVDEFLENYDLLRKADINNI